MRVKLTNTQLNKLKSTAKNNAGTILRINKISLKINKNNTYHHSINKKPVNADSSALTEKLRRILKLLNLKLMIESELLSITIFLVKVTLKIGQEKYLLLIMCWKLILAFIKLKI